MGIALSAAVLLGSMTACSGNGKPSGDTSSLNAGSAASAVTAPSEGKTATIRFMWWGDEKRHNSTLAAIDLYKNVNPNLTIEAEYGGWEGYQDKLTTQLAGGTAPDLMQVSFAWISDLQKKGGFFADLAQYPQLMDLTMFSESLINSFCRIDNAIVAVPSGASGFAFLVNKDTLARAGVTLGQKWTWDSYLEVAKKVHALGDDYYLSADANKETLYEKLFRPYIIGHTGNVWINDDYTMGFTRDNLVEAFGFLKTLNDARAWPSLSEVPSASTIAEDPRWISGKLATTFSWVSAFYPVAQPIGAAAEIEAYPVVPDGKDTAVATQPSMLFCANANSQNIEETIKFLNFIFTDEEALKELKDCRGIPSSKKGFEVAEANKLIDPLIKKSLELALGNSSTVPYSAISDDSELATYGKDVIEMLLFNKLTPETAADELISRYEIRLAEMKANQ